MQCSFRIFTEFNLVYKTYPARVTYKTVLALLDALEAEPLFTDGMMELDDLRAVTDLAITATELERFADLITGINIRKRRPSKKAVVAPAGPGRIAALGFNAIMKDIPGPEIGVFDTVDEALAFLGVPGTGILEGEDDRPTLH